MMNALPSCTARPPEGGPAETATIRERLRRELPRGVFEPRRERVFTALALVLTIVAASGLIVLAPMPGIACAALSLVCGCAYASLFFLGHEIAHGSVVRSRKLQDLLLWPAFAIFLLSPTLWRVWHNKVHHRHTNCAKHDPDNFACLESYRASAAVRFIAAMTPGSDRWLSLLYLPTAFTGHAQVVLWRQSRHCLGFESLNRARAIAESAAMAVFWCALAFQIGGRASVYVILIPMLVANTAIMSYIVTNHLLRPLVDDDDQLASSLSVTSHPWLDAIHFNFSHHAEHHLFPAMSSKHLPLVRAKLRRYAGERFLTPPHWKALLMVFRTPRIHVGNDVLIDPARGRVAAVAHVAAALGPEPPLISGDQP